MGVLYCSSLRELSERKQNVKNRLVSKEFPFKCILLPVQFADAEGPE